MQYFDENSYMIDTKMMTIMIIRPYHFYITTTNTTFIALNLSR